MMTLPNFTEPNPNIMELWDEQNRLVKQTEELLQVTGILEIFTKYGKVPPVSGSYAYQLMVYPDIDCEIVADIVSKQSFAKLVSDVLENEYVRKVNTADTVNFASYRPGRPKGFWIGLEIPYGNDRWGIDCWLRQKDWIIEAEDTYAERLRHLDQLGKDAVLLIKYDLIRIGLYGRKYSSADVYDAVLDKNVRSVNEFYES